MRGRCPITITCVALGGLLLTQLGSDDFVSALQEDVAQISALIINANSIPSPTPALTPPPTLFPMTYPYPPALSPNFALNISPTLSLPLALTSLPTLNYNFYTPCDDISLLERNAVRADTGILNAMTGELIKFSGTCVVGEHCHTLSDYTRKHWKVRPFEYRQIWGME